LWENDDKGSNDDTCRRKFKASDNSESIGKPKWQRIARLLLVFSLILFIFLTNRGRTVYLCLAGVSAVIFIQRFRWKEIAKVGVAFLILISIIVACFPRVRERCEKAYREAVAFQADNTVVFSGEESSIGRRLFMYKYGLMTVVEHPWFGTGTGSVKVEFDRQIAHLNRGSNSNWSGDTTDLHCEFLTMLMQFGVVGLIGYAIWLGTLWYYSTKIVWPWNMLGRCMAAMITISTIFSSHMSNVRTGCFYALMVALFFSAETRSENKKEESP
jgi:O-antigen ligase